MSQNSSTTEYRLIHICAFHLSCPHWISENIGMVLYTVAKALEGENEGGYVDNGASFCCCSFVTNQ